MMGRLATGVLSVIVGVGLVAGAASTASAQPTPDEVQQQAADLVGKGIQRQTKHDTDGAVALYKEAYCLIPEPALVYNIGTAYQEGNRAAEALSFFKMYLKIAPSGDLANDAKQAIKVIQPGLPKAKEVATILCEVKVPPVCLDGAQPVDGVCPKPAPSCAAGQELRDGACVTVAAVNNDTGLDGNGSGTTTGGKRSKTLFYAGIGTAGAGAVALGVGVAFGLKAKSASDAISNNMGDWTPELLAKQQEGKDAERNQIIFTVVGGAAVAGGAVMIVLGMRSHHESPESHARLVPFFTGDQAGFALAGHY